MADVTCAWCVLCCVSLSLCFWYQPSSPLYLGTPEVNRCSGGVGGGGDKGRERRDKGEITHTDVLQHTCEEGTLLTPFCSVVPYRLGKPPGAGVFVICVVFLFGLEIASSSVIPVFCFRSSCPLGSLGGGAGVTAHCAAGPTSSHFLFFLARISSPLLFVHGFSFDKYTIKLA